jgi:hypothetical protein
MNAQDRLVDQGFDQAELAPRRYPGPRAHFRCGHQPEVARKHRQPRPREPPGRGAKLVAPADCRSHRAVPGDAAAAADAEGPAAVVKLVEQLLAGQRTEPDSGKLERERHPVEPLFAEESSASHTPSGNRPLSPFAARSASPCFADSAHACDRYQT